ncbi:MAG: SLC13 family permease [Nocardioidaceae bacterium]|nr:SLC13 family permease [Nocardioidaceae bacterium]
MSVELIAILALVAIFAVATVVPINMGALGFVAAFVIGTIALDLTVDELVGGVEGTDATGFPSELVITLIGVTYLFAIARNNGSVDLIVRTAVRAVGGRVAAVPWVMFAVTGLLTAIGALGPAAVAIIAPIALGLATRYRISPLLMGMMVVHGAQAGGFSPISVYGVTVNTISAESGIVTAPIILFLASLLFNAAIGVLLSLWLGRDLFSRTVDADEDASRGSSAPAGGSSSEPDGTGTRTESRTASGPVTLQQATTLIGLLAVIVLALALELDIGFMAITLAVILALMSPTAHKAAVNQISWSTVLLIAGVLTFVSVLQAAGSVDYVGDGIASLGIPLLAALLLCYLGGVVSAFASSTAIIGVTIALAAPFLAAGDVNTIGLICALSVASTIVGVSPFSTNGALVIANTPESLDRDAFYKQVLGYSVAVTLIGPTVAWAAMVVVPGLF